MCSTCDVSKFNSYKNGQNEIFFNTLGSNKNTNLYLETKDKKNFRLVASSKLEDVAFTIYRCPTCGRKLY